VKNPSKIAATYSPPRYRGTREWDLNDLIDSRLKKFLEVQIAKLHHYYWLRISLQSDLELLTIVYAIMNNMLFIKRKKTLTDIAYY
jgi:hypothetical protein